MVTGNAGQFIDSVHDNSYRFLFNLTPFFVDQGYKVVAKGQKSGELWDQVVL